MILFVANNLSNPKAKLYNKKEITLKKTTALFNIYDYDCT